MLITGENTGEAGRCDGVVCPRGFYSGNTMRNVERGGYIQQYIFME